MTTAGTDGHVFSRIFAKRDGPYHLFDAGGRPLIRRESGAHVLGALVQDRTRLVFLDDAGCPELSALKITYPAGKWCREPARPAACDCGESGCRGRLVITLHEAHAGPGWTLTYRG